MMSRKMVLPVVLVLCFCTALFADDSKVVLVKDGEPNATIVVPAKHDHLDFAVKELVDHVRQATGATLPVKTEDESVEGTKLYLGQSGHTLELGIDESKLPSEGFVIRVFPDKDAVAIVGDTETLLDGWYKQPTEGNLWGVYRFLEDFLGIRWYLPNKLGIIIPKNKTLGIPSDAKVEDAPDFPIRTIRPSMSNWNKKNAIKYINIKPEDAKDMMKRMRNANAYGDVQANHSTYYFPRVHHDKPEFFAVKSDGTRALYPPNKADTRKIALTHNWHGYLDQSNPETFDQLVKDHVAFYENTNPELKKEWLRVHPERAPNEFRVSFAPEDGLLSSKAKEALTLYRPGIRWGQDSNYVFQFANKFAKAMYEKYPKKKFICLAYSSYVLPPDPEVVGKFPPNFIPQIAVMQPIANWKEPHIFDYWNKVTKDWRDLIGCEKVHFWQYYCWPSLPNVPFFWPGQLQKFYKKQQDHTFGAFLNGGPPGGIIGMHHLNYYFGNRVLWDTDYDIEAGLKEYCELMFGPAADAMYDFHNTLRMQWENVIWDLPLEQMLPTTAMLYGEKGTFPPAVMKKLKALLDKAQKTSGLSDIQAKRIEWTAKSHKPFFEHAEAIQSGGMPYNYAVKLPSSPKIDGDFSDSAWQATEWIPLNQHMQTGEELSVGSRVKAGWRDDGLYLAIENDEPFMEKLNLIEKAGGRICRNDSNEIYLDPGNTRSDHLMLAYDAAGKSFSMRNETGFQDTNWRPDGADVATKQLGDRWVTEIKIPWKSLGLDSIDFPACWVWNIFRHRRTSDPDHYLAIGPTYNKSTKIFSVYPQLFLIDSPALYTTFDQPYNKSVPLFAWNGDTRKRCRFEGAVHQKNVGGRRIAQVDCGVIPENQRKSYKMLTVPAYGSGPIKVEITDKTAIDFKIRWLADGNVDIQLQGRVRKGGKGTPKFFAIKLYKGKSKGKWISLQKKLVDLPIQKGGKIDIGDILTNISVMVKSPDITNLQTIELESVIIGNQTKLMNKKD